MAKIKRMKEQMRRQERTNRMRMNAENMNAMPYQRGKAREDAEEEELEQLDEPTEEITTADFDARSAEDIQKDYYGDSMPMSMMQPMPGPTSWEALDAEQEARDKAEAVEEAAYDVRKLVNNILCDMEMGPDEKSQAISEVGAGFAPRVTALIGEEQTDSGDMVEKDLDEMQINALLAHDARHTGLAERVTDIIKRQLTTRGRKRLESSDFALPDKKKYPIHDKAHVRNALARAAQQIQAGGAGAVDAKAALPKIRAAAKKFGIEVSTSKERNAILIEKDMAGDWRWVGWVSNNYIDWDGDIIAESAHKEYVDWLTKNMDMAPALLAWHTPGTAASNPVDYTAFQDGFLVMSGKLTEGEAQTLLKMQAETDLGMSHNSFVLQRDAQDPRVVLKYRMVEATHLPLEKAANPFTNIQTISKEVGMNLEEYLTGIYGDTQKAQAFLKRIGLTKQALDEAGLESKEQKKEQGKTQAIKAADVPNMDAIVKAVAEKLGMDELSEQFTKIAEAAEKVPVLEAVIKDLQVNQDERLAEKLTPKVASYAWLQKNRATTKKETVLKEEDEEDQQLAKKAPNASWMTEVFGVEPVVVDEETAQV